MAGVIANNYGSFPVVFSHGNGSVLTDTDGKDYVDFVSGIGVNCLGHAHPALVKAVQEQAAKQIHISNYYNSDEGLAFANELLAASGMERVFFGNSGAEANEAAIKLARKYGWLCGGASAVNGGASAAETRNVIVTLEKSFHGRTLATLRATGQEKFHAPCFEPFPGGFRHIRAGDYDALDTVFDGSVCALLIECVQGEGGVNLIDAEWAQAAAAAARKAGALVMCDEVQTGMGRTGYLFASEELGVQPDVVTTAKGIAGGVPMGACLFRGKARDVFAAGDHQSTFGGNPLACAAGRVVLRELRAPGFLDRVRRAGEYIRQTVRGWQLPCVKEVRGKGLMIGVDVAQLAAAVQKSCLESGLCISTAGVNTLRFLPPLVITDAEIERGLAVLKTVLVQTGGV
ncbi:acetylornithine/succinylornithine family transaminase [Treponema brennaborense]|uniref:Acetylornithine/succinyldiaminopimelate aminotransferase n=1 Tax=Treponema brennaborense (strain DSM 12168 / CIP 105900 / DD5/3) TaxID=906968 RepID=F4LKD9_TREBD|nr:acetylornithine/succinylornithine family transaminase [Treponema brennaborense]AEE16513.1 Acetylornithine/succinyldiaminopimelate aminotransferase [Treponema brennaborense DSM 12168]